MEQQQEKQNSLELSPQIVTMMTAEHYPLKLGQAQEVADIRGVSKEGLRFTIDR